MGPIYQNVAPGDSRFRRIMKRAEELRIPMLIHQGTTFCENVDLEIANPMQLQPLAIEFPKLRMVIAHMGHPWINETLVLIRKHPNLYSDISALYYRPWQFYNALVAAMEYGVLDRLLLGSDYPFTTPESTMDGAAPGEPNGRGYQPASNPRGKDRGDDSSRHFGLAGNRMKYYVVLLTAALAAAQPRTASVNVAFADTPVKLNIAAHVAGTGGPFGRDDLGRPHGGGARAPAAAHPSLHSGILRPPARRRAGIISTPWTARWT